MVAEQRINKKENGGCPDARLSSGLLPLVLVPFRQVKLQQDLFASVAEVLKPRVAHGEVAAAPSF